ncbi:TMEM175 family protein [Pandoraea sp. NPDC087047]|uniref:TMEM175 family protein n=1 Tax=Pandoraea sp. NPDC087047 TaxID=3364390 RepID=UPI00380BA6A0
MGKSRLEAFSDGVIAIIITIMVLEMKAPHGSELADLLPVAPTFFTYILSYVYVGLYWNNHHHLFQVVQRVSGGVLWANLHLLFWLSLIPFVTHWLGENHFTSWPTALYGVVLCMAAIAYYILARALLAVHEGGNAKLAAALGRDYKGKLSVLVYAVAIGLAFVVPAVSLALYALMAAVWLIPDRRIEHVIEP